MADNVSVVAGSATFTAASDDVGGVQYQVVKLDIGADGLSVPVTDLATSAKQTTAQTALDAIKTAVEIIDNAVSGSEFQVDVVAALPAGTNNIGDVDVLTLPALPTGTNTIGVTNFERVSTSTVTSVDDSASSVQLLASTSGRKGASFYNTSTVAAYLKKGTTASLTDFTVKIPADGFYELPMPVYTGRIDCIWASNASGAMKITEDT